MMFSIPKMARAAVLEELGMPLVVRDISIPKLISGQVLVKVFFSGVCRSQLMEVSGGRGCDPWLPHLLGHEGSGEVLAVGKDVTKVKPGDQVILGWLKSEGMDAPGAKYEHCGRIINSGPVTTFSNYTVVSENRLVKKPKRLSFEEAVLFGCALPTGMGMVLNELHPKQGQSVIVLGLGGIGLAALVTLKALGISNVIAVDRSDEKLIIARDLGVKILNSKKENLHQLIAQITNGGADICIESAGSVETIELGFSLIKKNGGKLLFASHPPDGQHIKLIPHELISGKSIAGSWGGGTRPDRDIPKMNDVLESANISLKRLISKQYFLEEINQALSDLEQGFAFRPIIIMNH